MTTTMMTALLRTTASLSLFRPLPLSGRSCTAARPTWKSLAFPMHVAPGDALPSAFCCSKVRVEMLRRSDEYNSFVCCNSNSNSSNTVKEKEGVTLLYQHKHYHHHHRLVVFHDHFHHHFHHFHHCYCLLP